MQHTFLTVLLLLEAATGRPLEGLPQPLAAAASAETHDLIGLQGSIPRDTEGREVHAHGGQLLRVGPTFYWVGTSRKEQRALVSSDINLYASESLSGSWRFLGSIFNWAQMRGYPDRWPYGHLWNPPPPYRIERPKILYHPIDRRYVLFFHLDTPDFEVPAVGIAISPDIRGPYTWVHHVFPDNNPSYDMTVYQDRDDPSVAYLIRSCPVMRHAVSRLRPDWLDTEGRVCSSSGLGAEGPAVFRWQGTHYLFASHLTGWEPNVPIMHESTAGGMCSTFWKLLPQPTDGPGADATFNSQSTYIFEHTFEDGTPLLLWMGDRWNSQGPGGVGNASYVWLPLLPRIGAPGFELVWTENWSLRAFKGATYDATTQQKPAGPWAQQPWDLDAVLLFRLPRLLCTRWSGLERAQRARGCEDHARCALALFPALWALSGRTVPSNQL